MRWKRAIRGGVKWACTLCAGALLVLGAWSAWCGVVLWAFCRAHGCFVVVGGACVTVETWNGGTLPAWMSPVGWRPEPYGEPGANLWHWEWGRERPPQARFERREFAAPIWVVILPLAVAGGLLWRADWRARPRGVHACRSCGYDRRGLAAPDAPCPECGAAPRLC